MPQPLSYRKLSHAHQAFVSAYIRNSCDPLKAAQFLHPQDSTKENYQRGYRLVNRSDVAQAIADKLQQQEEKTAFKREDIIARLDDLMKRALALPDGDQKLSTLKFHRECLADMSKVLGYNTTNVNTNEQRSINITLQGVDDQGHPIETTATNVPNAPETPEAEQLSISFPPTDPIEWSMDDLDDISEELPPDLPLDGDELPEGLD